MYQRGPDNAFVLYSYAIFLATVQEEDFDTIMELVRRARVADRNGDAFKLAELGFYKLVLQSPHFAATPPDTNSTLRSLSAGRLRS